MALWAHMRALQAQSRTMFLLQTSEAWPIECLHVFLDDFTQARLWSTSAGCALFVDEMQRAIGLPVSSGTSIEIEECKKRFHDGSAVSGAVVSVIRHRLLGAGSGGYVVSSVGLQAMICLAGCDMMYAVEVGACSIISSAPKLLLRVLSAPSLPTRDVSNICRLLPSQPYHVPSCLLALAIHRCYHITSAWPAVPTILKVCVCLCGVDAESRCLTECVFCAVVV